MKNGMNIKHALFFNSHYMALFVCNQTNNTEMMYSLMEAISMLHRFYWQYVYKMYKNRILCVIKH